MRTQVVRGWIVGLLAVGVLLVGAAPAGAHADLESSDPQDGATLTRAPEVISFTFKEEILAEGNAITLTDVAADTRLEVGPVVVEGDTASVTWPQASPAGQFRAAFRVVSADGHPIDGTITFTVEQAVGAVPESPAAVAASPSPASPSVDPVTPNPVAASASPAPAADDDSSLLVWVLGIGLAVLVGAGAGAWVMRRTR
jgi:methionine-rich copper-binding protein CopC